MKSNLDLLQNIKMFGINFIPNLISFPSDRQITNWVQQGSYLIGILAVVMLLLVFILNSKNFYIFYSSTINDPKTTYKIILNLIKRKNPGEFI